MARGALNASEHLLVESRVAADAAISTFQTLAPDKMAQQAMLAGGNVEQQLAKLHSTTGGSAGDLLNSFTQWSGPSMILTRGAMMMFLPRQEILLEHIAKEVQATAGDASELASGAQSIEALVGGAANGVVAGFLDDWRVRCASSPWILPR
jgi:hypothetical protein